MISFSKVSGCNSLCRMSNKENETDKKIRWIKRLMKEMDIYPQVMKAFDVGFTSFFLSNINSKSSLDDVIRELINRKQESNIITYLFEWVGANHPLKCSGNLQNQWHAIHQAFKGAYEGKKPFSTVRGLPKCSEILGGF